MGTSPSESHKEGRTDGAESDGPDASDTSKLADQGSAAANARAPPTLEQQLAQREAQVAVLERKLHHLRSWMGSINAQMAATNPQLVKNARRLYVGGVPPGTTEPHL
ncbi:hypothetical protein MNEG_15783 [Monoraphidium neglectum]|uniref:Uncharacterized protein n=1 Tax=Monoraphidium neglectum TaxID=145388 RepID=A0A0D2M9Z8_9CHLO|nr:hypothetical protein MNEG_15783 [Monoraphidium neglectum]KIY92180.1 hypothetical protein MNEG_15783 [Monoraphidium neglectum]|eukprot:XP_013891200.1 hypothetical protein MNEG_15783 [Monoraphidium neglectum]